MDLEKPDLASSSDAYAKRFAGPVGEYFLEVQTRIVRSMLPPSSDCTILDVGGGHAQLAVPLVAAGYDVTVFGSDATCCDRLDRMVGAGRYQFAQGNLLDLPWQDNTFDAVLAFRMLPHLTDWQRFVGELCRISKQCLIIDYPDVRSVNIFSSILFALKRTVEDNTTREYRLFKHRDILSALREHDYQQHARQGQFFFPMALHRLMKQATLSRQLENTAALARLTHFFGSPVIIKAVPTHLT